jgi:hypothetical protein
MNPIHELANRFQKYLTKRNDWVSKRALVDVATSHGYSREEAINGLNLMEDNPYPYDYCDVARRTEKGALQYRVWITPPEEIAKRKEREEWFDMLPDLPSPTAKAVAVPSSPIFGDPTSGRLKKVRVPTVRSKTGTRSRARASQV